jgi:hypothetical protein
MSSFAVWTAQQTRHLLFEAVIKGALRWRRLGVAPRFARCRFKGTRLGHCLRDRPWLGFGAGLGFGAWTAQRSLQPVRHFGEILIGGCRGLGGGVLRRARGLSDRLAHRLSQRFAHRLTDRLAHGFTERLAHDLAYWFAHRLAGNFARSLTRDLAMHFARHFSWYLPWHFPRHVAGNLAGEFACRHLAHWRFA